MADKQHFNQLKQFNYEEKSYETYASTVTEVHHSP